MTDQIILNADLRERTGSNKARVIRNIDGMIPAIIMRKYDAIMAGMSITAERQKTIT